MLLILIVINRSRATRFSLLNFHAGDVVIGFELFSFGESGRVAVTCFLFAR